MNQIHERFWQCSLDQLKQGYIEEPDRYVCLLCGHAVEQGVIYPENGIMYEAWRYMRVHIERAHGSVFDYLIGLDKRDTGLSDHQNALLRLFYEGKKDAEVQRELGTGSVSTIRNHRFALREKERQAKVFLTLMELLKEQDARPTVAAADPAADKDAESVKRLFPDGTNGRMHVFPAREKLRLVALREIAKRFAAGRTYTEKEVNEILADNWGDYVTVRRYLIEYGFLDRESDGSAYWLKQQHESHQSQDETEGEASPTTKGGSGMDRRKELQWQYKEEGTEAGVFVIRNTANGKVFLQSAFDLKRMNGKKFELQSGSSRLSELQQDWNTYGEAAFEFEVLERIDKEKLAGGDIGRALEKLEEKWMEQLQPYGDRGYHREKKR